MPADSNEDDLIRDLLEQADAEAQQEPIPPFATEWGFCVGCLVGPLLLIALVMVNALFWPEVSGSPVMFLISLVGAAVVGAIIGSLLLPSLLRRRHRKRH